MITDFDGRIEKIRRHLKEIDPPVGSMPWTEFRDRQTALFNDTIRLMLDVAEEQYRLDAILALEKKVGIDGDMNPDSIDFRISHLEQAAKRNWGDFWI